MSKQPWSTAPENALPAAGEVHVYCLSTEAGDLSFAPFIPLLSEDETARAFRLRRSDIRERCMLTRAWLRMILGRYLGVEPAGICFSYSASGKPGLAARDQGGPAAIAFNVTHTDGLSLLAFALGRRVGIDAERMRPIDHKLITHRYFSAAEVEALEGMPPIERRVAFFRCWTRKEAYIKALGEGLAAPLSGFEVSTGLDQTPALLKPLLSDTKGVWSLSDVEAGGNFAASLAVEGEPVLVRFFDLSAVAPSMKTTG